MNYRTFTISLALLIAMPVVAHEGVENPFVRERMSAMSTMADSMKTLVQMARGKLEFDAALAITALETVAEEAAATPELFAAEETDPKSEAKALIWSEPDKFAAKAFEMENIARGFALEVDSADDLDGVVKALGGACKACHADYRE